MGFVFFFVVVVLFTSPLLLRMIRRVVRGVGFLLVKEREAVGRGGVHVVRVKYWWLEKERREKDPR